MTTSRLPERALSTVLIPIPSEGFDPTETAVPWTALREAGHRVVFATPDGRAARADPRMVDGDGLGPLKTVLRAGAGARTAYAEMAASPEFVQPRRYQDVAIEAIDGLVLPGGHAPGMRPYLESTVLQRLVVDAFRLGRPVGAICHGVLLAARSTAPGGRSVLHGRKTTALTRAMELGAWALTAMYLGRYYRTYPATVQTEVTAALADPADFLGGPLGLARDAPGRLDLGYTVRDGNYLSARWPGDAHRFADDFTRLLAAQPPR